MTTARKQVLFIGAGRMAQAIIAGLNGNDDFSIHVANKGNEERLAYVREKYGVETSGSWVEMAAKMDIIVLAMPPDAHGTLFEELSGLVHGQLILTVAAGIGPSYMEAMLPNGTPVASLMPNTAAKQGESMTLYAPGQHVTKEHLELIEALLKGIGEYEKVTEQQIHELTAITGSAPAFMYLVAEALEQMAVETGITKEQARKLVAQMIAGSAQMLKTNIGTRELIDEVATPGGSTAAGLEVLEAGELNPLFRQAIDACREKAKI
ncbi:pyrroline-5-carboxylate reductase [Neobacillus niacini]|uniref:pyrroline-5-carboxylate reductase n=1 Tax=Neobacillus niacini TaxID=86668 RepID=UPI0021CAF234|nr:pyrroline-5-carboxylate reductase [Neobacillus niacini]MCM3764740.1 pyrroline-5-carboxylate reductase [Neobacillus niacini]